VSTRDLAYIALFAAIIAALAIFPPIMLPIGVPITAQAMGAMLAGGIIGAKRGALAMLLFAVLVAIGLPALPLLPGGRGGLGIIMGPTGGFIVSWIAVAFVVGYLTERMWGKLDVLRLFLICAFGGVVVSYAIGVPWMALAAGIGIDKAILAMAVYVPGDLIKAAVAAIVSLSIKRAVNAGYRASATKCLGRRFFSTSGGNAHGYYLDNHHRLRCRHYRQVPRTGGQRAFGLHHDDHSRHCRRLRGLVSGPGTRLVFRR
jgi:biotin transport system substrate-specific component